jgi:hypothetical protein
LKLQRKRIVLGLFSARWSNDVSGVFSVMGKYTSVEGDRWLLITTGWQTLRGMGDRVFSLGSNRFGPFGSIVLEGE